MPTAFAALGPLWTLTLIASLLALSLCDLLYRRVGNFVAVMPLIIGVSAHALAFGALAALSAFAVACAVFAASFVLYNFSIVGGADVKMAASLAACAGLERTGWFLIYTLYAAGVLGLAVGIDPDGRGRGLGHRLRSLVALDRLERARLAGRTVPLAVALSVGLLAAMQLH